MAPRVASSLKPCSPTRSLRPFFDLISSISSGVNSPSSILTAFGIFTISFHVKTNLRQTPMSPNKTILFVQKESLGVKITQYGEFFESGRQNFLKLLSD